MSLLYILFFISIVGISVLIGRKLVVLQRKQTEKTVELTIEIPNLEEIKGITMKKAKQYEHLMLVSTLKLYVLSMNFLKTKYSQMMNFRKKGMGAVESEAIEKKASGFLQLITDYKHRIRRIKHRIKEEEGIQ